MHNPIIHLSIVLFLGLLFSCDQEVSRKELKEAERLMLSHPDSALLILESIPSPEKMSRADYAAYCLLLTEAQDKSYYTFTSDSVIRVAAEYYEARNDKRKLPKVYYYLGRVHQEMQEIPYALEYYLKAKDSAGDNYDDIRLLSRIYNSIGSIYTRLHIYDDALEAYKQAEHYLYACKDSVGLPFVLRNMARIYHATEKMDSAIYYYEQAIDQARRTQNQYALSSSLTEISGLFTQRKDNEKAFYYLSFLGRENVSDQTALVYADLYLYTGKKDSAEYYLNQSLVSQNIYTKAASYKKLHQIKREDEDYKQALEYAEIYTAYKDSIQKIINAEAAFRTQNLYNFQKLTQEKDKYERMHKAKKQQIGFFLLISIASALIAVLTFLYQKQRRQNEVLTKEKLLKLKEEQFVKSEEKITANLIQIASLKETLQKKDAFIDQKEKELLTTQMALLEYENQGIHLVEKNRYLQRKKLMSSPIYLHLKEIASSGTMKKEHWVELRKTIDEIYNDFGNKLKTYCPKISDQEEKVCYLIKAGFSVTEIANLVSMTKGGVTLCRNRLYEKIHKTSGSAEDMEVFLGNL